MAKVKIGNVKYIPPIGSHHIQFNGEPTPAELYSNTTWEIDTAYQGKTLIGSGGSYVLGANGGNATHKLSVDELPSHVHQQRLITGQGSGVWAYTNFIGSVTAQSNSNIVTTAPDTGSTGGGQSFDTMPPYIVVNYWKRTA